MERINQFQAAQIANWPLTQAGYFALDYDNGDDDNLGFSTVSMATAGLAPLKTAEELQLRVPPIGKNRDLVIAIKPRAAGATYRDKADAEDARLKLVLDGYRVIQMRGVPDFADLLADRGKSAAVQFLVGPNIDGSFTITAPSGARSFSIAAGALTVEPALSGMRVRWKGNATPAIADAMTVIVRNGASTFVVAETPPAPPVAGDEFFIEQPAVAFKELSLSFDNLADEQVPVIVGLRAADPASLSGISGGGVGSTSVGFCHFAGRLNPYGHTLDVRGTYADTINGGNVLTGAGLRVAGVFTPSVRSAYLTRSALLGSLNQLAFTTGMFDIGAGCVIRNSLAIRSSGAQASEATPSFGNVGRGASTVLEPLRLVSTNLLLEGTSSKVNGVTVEGATGPAIKVKGDSAAVNVSNVSNGGAANTDVGIDVAECTRAVVVLDKEGPVTVTGTLGDIRLADGSIVPYTHVAKISAKDTAGNKIIGTGEDSVGNVRKGTNDGTVAALFGQIVRITGDDLMTPAEADTPSNADSVWGVLQAAALDAPAGDSAVIVDGHALVKFDADPTAGAIAYLSEANPGNARDTTPPVAATNQKLRLGRVVKAFPGEALGIVSLNLDPLPVTADGAP